MIAESKMDLWFGKSEETDRYVTEQYKELLEKAKRGELDDWAEDHEGLVALVVLLDQFSRNIYRGSAEMYAADEKVLAISKDTVERGVDVNMPAAHRIAVYMPFMHSEKFADQEKCVELFEKLHDEIEGEAKKMVSENIKWAIKHREVIKKYGRFPHRNEILGRDSTEAEKDYLAQPDAGF
jgi:uncharacterized protein (DUF924 family)